MLETFVIVGASLAGGGAAATLRQEGFDGRVILIGAEPQPPYERPPLSKEYLRGESSFEQTLVQSSDFYGENGIETRFGVRASRVDPAKKVIELDGEEGVAYDKLLVATGGRNMLGKDEPYDDILWFWSDQYDFNLQYTGFHTEWDELIVRGSMEERNFVAFYQKDERVLAAVAVNRGKDLRRSMRLIKAQRPVDATKLQDPDVDLRALVSTVHK